MASGKQTNKQNVPRSEKREVKRDCRKLISNVAVIIGWRQGWEWGCEKTLGLILINAKGKPHRRQGSRLSPIRARWAERTLRRMALGRREV